MAAPLPWVTNWTSAVDFDGVDLVVDNAHELEGAQQHADVECPPLGAEGERAQQQPLSFPGGEPVFQGYGPGMQAVLWHRGSPYVPTDSGFRGRFFWLERPTPMV